MQSGPDLGAYFERKRRTAGLLLGLLAGLIFGLVSNGVNTLVVSGVTFYQPPFGTVGNALLWTVIGGLLGWVSAWPDDAITGIFLGCVLSGLLMQASIFLSGNLRLNLTGKLLGLLGFYLPFAALSAPLLMLIRAAADDQREWHDAPWFSWRRLRLPLVLALICGGIALLWLLPGDGRAEVAHLDGMVRSGLSAGSPDALPAPLREPLVGDFSARATPSFSVELVRQSLNRFMIPFIPRAQYQPAVVVARFSSGWSLACLYVHPQADPFCRGYDDLAAETGIGENPVEILLGK